MNWRSLRMFCHRKSNPPLASFTELWEYWETFWSLFVLGLVKWRVGHVLTDPAHQKVQASARLALIVNPGCVKNPWFLFLQTCIFSSATRDAPGMEQQLSALQVTFLPLCSIWAIPEQRLELSLWGELRVWISQTREDMVSITLTAELFPIGNVVIALVWFGAVGCDIWSPIHTSLRVQGWSLISGEKRNTRPGPLQYSPLVELAILHARCWLTGVPWSVLCLLCWCLGAQGCLPLLTAYASYLGVAKRNVAVPKSFCRYSP